MVTTIMKPIGKIDNLMVTVILPVHNGGLTVGRALYSVAAQDFDNYEVVIVDDGSKDGTADVLNAAAREDSRLVVLRNKENIGLQRSLNRGIAVARGKYIARLDADDAWSMPDKLSRQVEFLESHRDYVAVGTGAIVVDESGQEMFRYLKPRTDNEIRQTILGNNCFLHPSVLIRRSALEEVGGYDVSTDVLHVEDYDLWLRLGQVGKLANLPIYGVLYTSSSGQISAVHRAVQFRRSQEIMKKYRASYPNYFRARARRLARSIVYGQMRLGFMKKLTARLKQ